MGWCFVARNARVTQKRSSPRSERLVCECGFSWTRLVQPGRSPRWCSDACKQRGYREEVKARAAEEAARAEEEAAWRRWQEEWEARQQQRRQEEEQRQQRAAGGSGGSYSSAGRRPGRLSVAEARALVFKLAKLADNGATTLKRAYWTAAKLHHPDHHHHVDGELFKVLSEAAAVLKAADLL